MYTIASDFDTNRRYYGLEVKCTTMDLDTAGSNPFRNKILLQSSHSSMLYWQESQEAVIEDA